jgi:hypothetical protein
MLLVVLSRAVFSQDASKVEVAGRVVYKVDGARIPDAYVVMHNMLTSTDTVVRADNDGKWKFDLSPGIYNIFVSSPGFAPFCDSFEIRLGKPMTIPIVLSADEKTLMAD